MSCGFIRKKKKGICIGDLDKRITIQVRYLTPPEDSGVDYSQKSLDYKTVWASLETTRGEQLFDGVNINNAFTHIFYIRYICNVSFENWVEYCGNKYDIIDTEDYDEKNEFIALRCTKRGAKTSNANLS